MNTKSEVVDLDALVLMFLAPEFLWVSILLVIMQNNFKSTKINSPHKLPSKY